MPIPVDVFISYAHATAQAATRQLRDELTKSGLKVFLDEREIQFGSPFPREIADALVGSRLSIVFADETYFQRPWCVYEFQVITGPYRAAGQAEASQIEHVIVALPSSGDVASIVAHLPPPLARMSWPAAERTAEIAGMIRSRLAGLKTTLGSRLADVNDDALARLRLGGDIPLAWATAGSPVRSDGHAGEPGGSMCMELVPETRGELFIGRGAELWRVFHYLQTCRTFRAHQACAIQGPGGSGKSQLAAEFIARYGKRFFPGGVIWISAAGDEQSLVDQFRNVWRTLAPQEADPDVGVTDAEQQRQLLAAAITRRLESQPAAGELLWVVDDVPELAAERPRKISYWCPALGRVSVLATARRTGLEQMDSHIDLAGLPVAAAVDLLTRPKVDRQWLKEDEWADITEWVGGLPLAIAILRTSLSDGFTTVQALKVARKQEPSVLLDLEMDALRGEVADERLRGVTEAFEFSYRALSQVEELRHAAQLVAHLAPFPLAENILVELVPAAVIGKLAKRSWVQASAASSSNRAVRRWTMHRIPASYLRARTAVAEHVFTDLFNWLRRMVQVELADGDAHGLGTHLMVIRRRMVACLDKLEPGSLAIRAACDFAVVAAGVFPRRALAGLRFLAAGLADNLGAGDEVAARLEQAYESGNEAIVEAIPHMLQALQGSPRAVALMVRLLEDPRDIVRLQSIIHAGSLAALPLALPLLDAILKDPTDSGTAAYDLYLDNRCPVLRTILSELARRLNNGEPGERIRAAKLLGHALFVNGKDLLAGGFTSRHVVGALLHVALHDDSESVARASIAAASQYFDEEAYHIITKALSEARDSERRARVLETLGEYLSRTQRPPPPKPVDIEFKDSGGMAMQIDFGKMQPLPPEVYGPLLEAAKSNDPLCSGVAARAIMDTNVGRFAVGQVVNQLLDEKAFARVEVLAGLLAGEDPDFTNAYWWRGKAREALGDADAALADISTVIRQAPNYADALLRRGQLLCNRLAFGDALPDLLRAAELVPQLFAPHHLAALCLYNLNRHTEAEAAADRAIALAPQVGEAWFFRGIARYADGRATEALEDIRRTVELDPTDERASQFKIQIETYLSNLDAR